MAQPKEYAKATARWQGLINGSSLWLGSDHVLSVRSMRYLEEYRRYYYRDIQALMVREGPRPWFPGWLWFAFAGLALASVLFTVTRTLFFAQAFEAALFALCCLVLYQSIANGCYCYVVTAVATEELTGVRTKSGARKAKAAILERIAAAQGVLPADWQERIDTSNQETGAGAIPLFKDRGEPTAPAPSLGIWAATAAILCTAADGVFSFGQLRHWPLPEWIGLSNVFLGVAAAVTALVLLRQRSSFSWLRNAALLCVLVMGSVTYFAHILGTMMAAFPPNVRAMAGTMQRGVGMVNVTGDLVMVGFALVLWLRQSSRTALASNQPAVSTGEL